MTWENWAMVWVHLLLKRWRDLLRWWRVGGKSCPGPTISGREVQHGVFGEMFIERVTFSHKWGAGGWCARILRAMVVGNASRRPITLVWTVELTGTIETLFHSYTWVLNVAVKFLTLNVSYKDVDILPDIDQVIINLDAACEQLIWVSASHF